MVMVMHRRRMTLSLITLFVLLGIFYLFFYSYNRVAREVSNDFALNTYGTRSNTYAYPTTASLFRRTLSSPDSEVDQVKNYTRLERVLHRVVPQPRNFEKGFASLCWHSRIDFTAIPGIYSLTYKLSDTNVTREEAQSLVASIQDRSHDNRLVCLPSVFLPSFPKSGSTSLYNTLVRHPLIVDSELKETHFFIRFPFENDDIDTLAAFSYLRNFERLANSSMTNHKCLSIDGSQSILWDTRTSGFLDEIPLLIRGVFPRLKFVVIMRDPVKRFHSDFWFFTYQCVGHSHSYWKKIGPRMLHQHVMQQLDKIQKCLQQGNGDEICVHYSLVGAPRIFENENCGEVRLGIGAYYVHIQRWLRTFPINSFHFVRMEDFLARPYAIIKEIWKFLDIPTMDEESLHVDIQSSYYTSYPTLLPETEKALNDFYQPYNLKLSQLLEDDRYLWKDVTLNDTDAL